jgi:hypothetical protein
MLTGVEEQQDLFVVDNLCERRKGLLFIIGG